MSTCPAGIRSASPPAGLHIYWAAAAQAASRRYRPATSQQSPTYWRCIFDIIIYPTARLPPPVHEYRAVLVHHDRRFDITFRERETTLFVLNV